MAHLREQVLRELDATASGDSDARAYYAFHRMRYAFLMETLHPLLASSARVLDVGLSVVPRTLLRLFPHLTVATLGFDDARYRTPGEWEHYVCDLNQPGMDWSAVGSCDIVILAEVIEHLHRSPRRVIGELAGLLRPGGHLVIQTPNAASLEKRLKLAAGVNPYEMIRDNGGNPGHFREYTGRELKHILAECGLSVASCRYANYFRPSAPIARLYNHVCGALPSTFRDGMTIVGRK